MAALKYNDDHNKIAYLGRERGCEDFTDILRYLDHSPLRCMGRIDSLETELGKSKKIMGGAILTLVSRVKKLEKTVKKMRDTRLVVDASTEEGDEREEEEVPLRRKRSAYRRARTEFTTPAFEQFRANISASVAADKGKAPLPELDIPAEFVAEDAQA
ncbi:hypothetical protein Tco_1579551, partial [Tanacetum coccineum]